MSDITVVMPTSPIPTHPDTAILEETVASVRHHLPDSEILLTFDGLPPPHSPYGSRSADYAEYTRRALMLADHGGWGAVCPFVFDTHQHQSGMMQHVLPEIKTPLVLYVEHDTPLVTDEPIEWHLVRRHLMDGTSSLVRFHHEAVIPEPHEHMMHGFEYGLGLLKTSQWSQRPHLTTKPFYERIMTSHFAPGERVFIEDRMFGVVFDAVRREGDLAWLQYRLHIYVPAAPLFPGNLKRSYHLDGRKTKKGKK